MKEPKKRSSGGRESPSKSKGGGGGGDDGSKASGLSNGGRSGGNKDKASGSRRRTDDEPPNSLSKNERGVGAPNPKKDRRRRDPAEAPPPRRRGSSADRRPSRKMPMKRRTSIDDMDYDLEGLVARRHSNNGNETASSSNGRECLKGKREKSSRRNVPGGKKASRVPKGKKSADDLGSLLSRSSESKDRGDDKAKAKRGGLSRRSSDSDLRRGGGAPKPAFVREGDKSKAPAASRRSSDSNHIGRVLRSTLPREERGDGAEPPPGSNRNLLGKKKSKEKSSTPPKSQSANDLGLLKGAKAPGKAVKKSESTRNLLVTTKRGSTSNLLGEKGKEKSSSLPKSQSASDLGLLKGAKAPAKAVKKSESTRNLLGTTKRGSTSNLLGEKGKEKSSAPPKSQSASDLGLLKGAKAPAKTVKKSESTRNLLGTTKRGSTRNLLGEKGKEKSSAPPKSQSVSDLGLLKGAKAPAKAVKKSESTRNLLGTTKRGSTRNLLGEKGKEKSSLPKSQSVSDLGLSKGSNPPAKGSVSSTQDGEKSKQQGKDDSKRPKLRTSDKAAPGEKSPRGRRTAQGSKESRQSNEPGGSSAEGSGGLPSAEEHRKKKKRITKKAIRKRVKRGREFASSVSGLLHRYDSFEASGGRRPRGDRRKSDREGRGRRGAAPGGSGGGAAAGRTPPGEATSELDGSHKFHDGGAEEECVSAGGKRPRSSSDAPRSTKNRRWKCWCCLAAAAISLAAGVAAILLVLTDVFARGGEVRASFGADELPGTEREPEAPSSPADVPDPGEAPSSPADVLGPGGAPPPVGVLGADPRSDAPSGPSRGAATTGQAAPATFAIAAPAPSPYASDGTTIAVIVQLDAKPEETGFSLVSSDGSATYVSRPIGSFAGRESEVVMEVVAIPEGTELVFEVTDGTGDGLCCAHGSGFYRVLAGTGDRKITMISGQRSAKYLFVVGEGHAVQIGGVDPNEYCKPCPDGRAECGRCAWCDAAGGFRPDEVVSWQCRTDPTPIPRRCFLGMRRVVLHNRYVVAMAGCPDGFEARPRLEASGSPAGSTACVEEARCVRTFHFAEPDCDAELAGSSLARETCQDKIGGFAFGYDWGRNAPREEECPSSGDFAKSIAPRCCEDQVAFCSTFDEDEGASVLQGKTPPTPMPAAASTYAPTRSHAPTWDGHPITLLIQLDDFPGETGFSITSADRGTTYLQRRRGYYKKSHLVVERVRIPEGIEAVLTIDDGGGDGICCENGHGYFQVYSDGGSLILDETGAFSNEVERTFVAGEPLTPPPTVTAAPTSSVAPTFDLFPVTIAVQLDQWSDETGFSIRSADGGDAFFDWPAGSFSERPFDLVVETVELPRDVDANFLATDRGGDGFCCLYGDGYVKIFAGASAEDESALLAFERAEFQSDLAIKFRAGPAPSVAPATTPRPTVASNKMPSTGSTSSILCGRSGPPPCVEVTVVVQLDKFSAETSWSIGSSDGSTNFVTRPTGYFEEMQSQKIIETVSLPDDGIRYRFTIVDFMGDGICCWAGNGWYSLYEGRDVEDESTQLFHGRGDFGRERSHAFVAGRTPAPTTAPPTRSPRPSVTKYAIEVTIKLDGRPSQTGWSIAAEDGGANVAERHPGYYSGRDASSTIVEVVRLAAGEYRFSLFDAIGDGFCCEHGRGYFSLTTPDGDVLLYEQGRFEFGRTETFTVGGDRRPRRRGGGAGTTGSKSALSLRGSGSSSTTYEPNRRRWHADETLGLSE